MTIRALVSTAVVGLLVGACDGRTAVPTDDPPADPGQPTTGSLGCGATDAPGTPLGFHVSGDGLAAWEGRTVTAAAIENDQQPKLQPRRPVLIATVIRDGAFALSCPGSLRENNVYPSWALYVDGDGDGRCTPADAGYQSQLYAWNRSIEVHIPSDGRPQTIADAPVYALYPPIGSDAADFCSGYFYP